MKKTFSILATIGLAAASASASAIQYQWDLDMSPGVSPGSGQTNTSVCASGIECQLTYTSLSGSQTLYARAYSTAGDYSTGNFVSANIARYAGSGLGVQNTVGDSGEGSSPEHALDNQGARDIIVLEAPTANFVWDSLSLGWYSGDSDVQVYVGGSGANSAATLDFRNLCFSGCTGTSNRIQDASASGFTDLGLFTNVGQNGGTISNLSSNLGSGASAQGRYLVISGALNGGYVGNDFFKVSAISGHKVVPAPATAALLLIGLAGLGWVRRSGVAGAPR